MLTRRSGGLRSAELPRSCHDDLLRHFPPSGSRPRRAHGRDAGIEKFARSIGQNARSKREICHALPRFLAAVQRFGSNARNGPMGPQILGSVTPFWPWYLPPRSRYDVSQTSSDSKKITCATPSLA